MIQIIENVLLIESSRYRCAIGKGGFAADKKEGDGATPLGFFPMRECWYRADRMNTPVTKLPLKIIHPDDGWCDDPKSPDYNRHVKLPFAPSHEKLWRDDGVYDLIVPLGYNDDPVVPGRGSAIFMHIAKPNYLPTEGCVALAKNDLLDLLPQLDAQTLVIIKKA